MCISLNGIYRASGFNRYMVECECFTWSDKQLWFWVLIDTWWNVNDMILSVGQYVDNVLIDTWWNVNLSERE